MPGPNSRTIARAVVQATRIRSPISVCKVGFGGPGWLNAPSRQPMPARTSKASMTARSPLIPLRRAQPLLLPITLLTGADNTLGPRRGPRACPPLHALLARAADRLRRRAGGNGDRPRRRPVARHFLPGHLRLPARPPALDAPLLRLPP